MNGASPAAAGADALDELFSRLSREPDLDAPELRAYDATDRLLLQTAGRARAGEDPDGALAVIGDRHGALTLGAAVGLGARGIRVFQDGVLARRALAGNADRLGWSGVWSGHPLEHSLHGPDLLAEARLVLLQLPRSLAELDEIAQAIARWAPSDVVLLAGGRVKHMSPAMNEVLARSFASVSAGLAQQKSRVLRAARPRAVGELGPSRFPVQGTDPELPFVLSAYGATFGGAALDHGSRLLLRTLRERPVNPGPGRIVDLGCGNGALAVSAARAYPAARVIATDQSAAAVAATRLTAEAAGVGDRVDVRQADVLETVADGWAELILLNPPFHSGATVHTGIAHRMIRAAADALAPGGELRLVFNSRLGYRAAVERSVGPVTQLARDHRFTVLAATRR